MFLLTQLTHYWLLLGSPMTMDPHPSQQHVGLQHTAWRPQQEVTRPKAQYRAWMLYFLNGLFPASFSLFSSFQYTVDSKQMFNVNKYLPMIGFEPWTSCIGSDRSTNWATTTSLGCYTWALNISLWQNKETTATEIRSHRPQSSTADPLFDCFGFDQTNKTASGVRIPSTPSTLL